MLHSFCIVIKEEKNVVDEAAVCAWDTLDHRHSLWEPSVETLAFPANMGRAVLHCLDCHTNLKVADKDSVSQNCLAARKGRVTNYPG